MSAPFALLAAALFVGGGLALGIARWWPGLFGAATISRPPVDPTRLWHVAAILMLGAAWTAFAFWQGTGYARLDCVQVERVAAALEETDQSVRMLTRGITEFGESVDDLTRRARAASGLPVVRRDSLAHAASGGVP